MAAATSRYAAALSAVRGGSGSQAVAAAAGPPD